MPGHSSTEVEAGPAYAATVARAVQMSCAWVGCASCPRTVCCISISQFWGCAACDGCACSRGLVLRYRHASRVTQAAPHRLPPGGHNGRCLGYAAGLNPGRFHPT